jgi:hypothetical protein
MEGKTLVTSKTAWAQVITMILIGLRMAGIETAGIDTDAVAQWMVDAATLAAAGYGLYGRLVAYEPIVGIFRKSKHSDKNSEGEK